MLSGKGFYRGSTILVSGSAGTGKTSLAAQFVDAACRRGERALFFIMEESQNQLLRNMHSIGIDLYQWVKKGLLFFNATRPTLYGLETHLANSIKLVNKFKPSVVVLDPINSFVIGRNIFEVNTMLVRLVDYLKMNRVTALFTSNTAKSYDSDSSDVYVSSLIDSWVLLMYLEKGGERNRGLEVLKSRGMAHSNQMREFTLGSKGINLLDVCIGPEGVVTGSARISQTSKDTAEQLFRQQEIGRKQSGIERKRIALEAQIEVLRSEFENEKSEALKAIGIDRSTNEQTTDDREKMSKSRGGDNGGKKKPVRKKAQNK
jgi:circadian clock protein KaiC